MPSASPSLPEFERKRRMCLPSAARRALDEADARNAVRKADTSQTELGGRDGPDPVRYGDWERNGLAIDF